MKKLIATTLIIMISTLSASAQTVSSAQIKSDVAKALENKFSKITSGEVKVKVVGTQFSELQLPDGKLSYKVVSDCTKILPRDIKKVDIYVNDKFVKNLNLPIETRVYKDVLVASDVINREQSITNEYTMIKKVDVSNKMDYILDERMLQKEMSAKKTFQKGEILDKRFVKMRPDVQRNGEVRIFFVSNGTVMISIDGTAMADGMCGDYINVENKNYKKVYNGKVIGENRVLVAI